MRNPERALGYARKAVALSKGEKAIYLDTLAEALYANRLFDEAVATEENALSMEPENEFYPDQLKKFQAAQRQAGGTDTNAALTGAILGAVHRLDAIPAQWRIRC